MAESTPKSTSTKINKGKGKEITSMPPNSSTKPENDEFDEFGEIEFEFLGDMEFEFPEDVEFVPFAPAWRRHFEEYDDYLIHMELTDWAEPLEMDWEKTGDVPNVHYYYHDPWHEGLMAAMPPELRPELPDWMYID